jgi:hypothetical protein
MKGLLIMVLAFSLFFLLQVLKALPGEAVPTPWKPQDAERLN